MKVRLPEPPELEKRREQLRPIVEVRQRETMAAAALDYDTNLLWSIRNRLGWGRRRLKRFYSTMLDNHKELHGDFGAAKYRVMRKRLEDVGCDVDGMLRNARIAASKAASTRRCKPVGGTMMHRMCCESANGALRKMSYDFEALLIYVLKFDFGVSRPGIQLVLNDCARMIAAYDVGSDRGWYTAKRDELMAVGVNVLALQDTAEECIRTEREMEEETC